jgi:hypothetical protein
MSVDWKDVLGVVNKLAPAIATGLGGPLAGGAVTALQQVFGLTPSGTTKDDQSQLAAAISGASADQLLALKRADQEYMVKMQELGFKNIESLEALATSDRNSARQREIAIKDNTPKILAYGITAGFFSILGFMLFSEVPLGSKDILNIMLGTLGTSWVGVIGYYFGTTSSSQMKTQLLARAEPIKADKQELF